MAIRAQNENIPVTIIINRVDHYDLNESFKKKVKDLVSSDVCGETSDSEKFKIIHVSLHDDILMNNLGSKMREIALTNENSGVSNCLIDQSGVGKSSLINSICHEENRDSVNSLQKSKTSSQRVSVV